MALFRVDYSGRGELSERQQKVITPTTHLVIVFVAFIDFLFFKYAVGSGSSNRYTYIHTNMTIDF